MMVGPPSQHSESDLKVKQWQEKIMSLGICVIEDLEVRKYVIDSHQCWCWTRALLKSRKIRFVSCNVIFTSQTERLATNLSESVFVSDVTPASANVDKWLWVFTRVKVICISVNHINIFKLSLLPDNDDTLPVISPRQHIQNRVPSFL